MGARPPPKEEIREAYTDFLAYKAKRAMTLNDVEVPNALNVLKYLQTRTIEEEEKTQTGSGLTTQTLLAVLRSLRGKSYEKKEDPLELARLAFEELRFRKEEFQIENPNQNFDHHALLPFLGILSLNGHGARVLELIEQRLREDHSVLRTVFWKQPIRAFIREGDEEKLLKTLELMQEHGIHFDAMTHQVLVTESALQNDFEAVKKWYAHKIYKGSPTFRSKATVLKMCIRNNDLQWGQRILDDMLLKEKLTKAGWDLTFQWAAAKGKGVDEIERMMDVMERKNTEEGIDERPDIDTINALVEYANSMNDPYTAERIVALADRRNIQPNGQTYILQLDYRLKVGDIDGARKAYTKLQSHEVLDDKDIPLLNQLIVSLCNAKDIDYDNIMDYVSDLTERKGRFEAGTVSALCRLHLRRNELHDVIDLLQTHAFHFSFDERALVRDAFVTFIFQPANSTAAAWDAYSILREFFTEMENGLRVRIMDEFFRRRRCDMGIHVFGHMRQFQHREKRPTAQIYTKCFEGIAKLGDIKSLEIVHNMLKLDTEVELNTQLNNALMLAYIGCEDPRRALEFWEDIVHSREGPTYNSICIAFRACEFAPFGDKNAREIWNRLKRFGIETTREIYASYVGALAGQGLIEEAATVIGEVKLDLGSPPDALM